VTVIDGSAAAAKAPAEERFPALILALRWATVLTGAILSLLNLRSSAPVMAATSLLCLYAGLRLLRPLPPNGREATPLGIAGELAVALTAVAMSGGFGSPFVFVTLVPVLLAGLTQGYSGGFVAAAAASVPLLVVGATLPSAHVATETASQVILVYAATGALAGYARRLFVDAVAEQASFEDRVSTLTEANALLAQLTQVALTLPSSLDLGDTVSASMTHIRQLFDCSGAAVLVLDAATGTWRAEGVFGLPAPAPMSTSQLPPPLLQLALRNGSAVPAGGAAVVKLGLDPAAGHQGLWPETHSGLYAPLVARNHLVALVALERVDGEVFEPRDVDVLTGLAEPLALAIDNGLWFDRLRMLGAEGERDRLARDLHDRFAQGLAYVNLELDRLSRHPEPGPELIELRQQVHGLLGDVRETLRQLRSRVTPTTGLAELLAAELPRFADRTGVSARFGAAPTTPRLPLPVEQELWRISQEALGNVERHAKATVLDVTWTCDGRHGRLVVADNGGGFDTGGVITAASGTSGMTAMRERANAIGARLLVDSHPGGGTWIQVEVTVNPGDTPGPAVRREVAA
jgi:signal transduction histidine kinase